MALAAFPQASAVGNVWAVSTENPDMWQPRRYEAKEMTFHLKEPGHGGQKDRTYASVTLDVANFAPQEGPTSSPSEFKVVLFQGTREIQTHLHLTIQSQWLTVCLLTAPAKARF
jgi:hypothetical protein